MTPDTQRSIAVGIDLGTTYSVVARVDRDGQPRIIPNSDNQRTTPSVVYVDGTNVLVGTIAKEQAQVYSDHTIQFIKPFVGRRRKRFTLAGQEWRPEELSALVLRKVVGDAEAALGGRERITHAVITVPAFFTEQQRKSTEDAGRIAGLEVLSIINEPTAAALAYGFDTLGADKTVVVYDLGGGTFDVTVMRIEDHTVSMLATDGDVQLGGKDWDERLIEHVCEVFEERRGVNPGDDPNTMQALYAQTEQAKLRLSKLPSTRVAVTHGGHIETVEITREAFEEMTEDLLAQTETTLQLTLQEAGIEPSQVDECLLVGGSTRMTAVRDMVRETVGREPQLVLNPDECVAQGAAIHTVMEQLRLADAGRDVPAPALEPDQLQRFREMHERLINPHTLGIVALDKDRQQVVAPIIVRRAMIPCRQVRTFHTSTDSQEQIRVVVLEGECPEPEGCTELGTCLIKGLPPGLAKGTPIEVTFECNADGRLQMTARLPTIQQSIQSLILRTLGMSDDEIETARMRIEALTIQ